MNPRVVLDTNVVVSALLKSQSLEDHILRLALAGYLTLYISPAIMTEYADVLPRPKLKLERDEIVRTLSELKRAGR